MGILGGVGFWEAGKGFEVRKSKGGLYNYIWNFINLTRSRKEFVALI
mgnify:CR=1